VARKWQNANLAGLRDLPGFFSANYYHS